MVTLRTLRPHPPLLLHPNATQWGLNPDAGSKQTAARFLPRAFCFTASLLKWNDRLLNTQPREQLCKLEKSGACELEVETRSGSNRSSRNQMSCTRFLSLPGRWSFDENGAIRNSFVCGRSLALVLVFLSQSQKAEYFLVTSLLKIRRKGEEK